MMPAQGTITFVPSVHFSPAHCRRVRETIREREPDLVAVELDPRRLDRLEAQSRPDLDELVQELPPATAASHRALQAIQRTVVRLYGLDPTTTDMEVAVETAAELDIDLALIDESIETILSGLTDRVSLETVPKLLARAQGRALSREVQTGTPISTIGQSLSAVEQPTTRVEQIEDGDDVQPMIDQLRRLLPEVTDVLIDQRDLAMAQRLHKLRREGNDVVAVVGAGHHNGIRRHLAEFRTRNTIPAVEVPIRSPAWNVTRIPIQ